MKNNRLDKNQFICRQQVAIEFHLPVRFLEECARKTRETGILEGPIFYRFGNTIKYRVQHIEEYIAKNEINENTAKGLDKMCEKSKQICKKYSLAKKCKKSPHITQKHHNSVEVVEFKKKKIN